MRSTHNIRYPKIALWIIISLILAVAAYILWSKFGGARYPNNETAFGVTFSTTYAESLDLDWKAAYIATLDDLNVRHFRIPVYWNQIEQQQDVIVLDDIIWMLEEAEKRDADVLLVVGRRVPRWPECHVPDWAAEFSEEQIQREEVKMITRVVSALKDYPAIERWQVQNEPFFKYFGECAPPDPEFIQKTVSLVKHIDPDRKIVITDSGELSTWVRAATTGDILGISLYRVTWNPILGYLRYPLPPSYYSSRAKVFKSLVDDVIITELQAEPWVSGSIMDTPIEEQYESMNVDRFRNNIDYVRQTGFSEVYLWGIEWWYWLKYKQNDGSMWEAARAVFYSSK